MKRSAYLDSTGGRAAAVLAFLAVASLGATAIAGAQGAALLAIAAAPPILIVVGLLTCGLSISEHPTIAALLVCGLPIAGGPYYALMNFAARGGMALGIGLVVLSIAPLARALRRRPAEALTTAAAH